MHGLAYVPVFKANYLQGTFARLVHDLNHVALFYSATYKTTGNFMAHLLTNSTTYATIDAVLHDAGLAIVLDNQCEANRGKIGALRSKGE